ncbi:SPOCS domain-containing protein [Frisingicoccus sp.]|uniref:DUF3794 and LysM peptidoglycan-binding domain-containing protein n=1 Tax=Frisingicoccus sp. TaxID=1918627 RepID=UPI0025C5737A|nr:SPOCS domain-containing protein [Frisingicoccus sp.]MDD6231695.1 DUF3794 domain-containing protein [Frisingicoccus sp.]MDY5955975.1 DUF3794 domain-containing protein [Frisingicoccus sp.]
MNLSKTYIQVPTYKHAVSFQVTLDNDFNVPDARPDMERIIQEKGTLNIRDIKPMRDKCVVRGELNFGVLYMGDDGGVQLQSIEGAIPFEETVNMDGLQEMDQVYIRWDMEDLRTGMINSRKISIRSIIVMHMTAMRFGDEEVAAWMENREDLWVQNKSIHASLCCIRQKDQLRIREESILPSNRPNMMEIIWHQENLENMDIKLQDGGILIRGQLSVFLLYRDEVLENPVNDVELAVPVEGKLDMPEVIQEMIPDIKVHIDHLNLDIRSDKDGEARVVGVETVLAAEINIYKEETLKLLQDIYSPKVTLIPEGKTIQIDNLILKNQSRCLVREKVRLASENAPMMQICHTHANVKIDQTEMTSEGILVEGVVYIGILYVSSDDRKPVNSSKAVLPFSYTVEAKDISEKDSYDIYPSLEQLNASMTDNNEIEVKMIISLDTSVFKSLEIPVVNDVHEEPLDFEKIEAMPGITGHVVSEGDSIWNLAKRYYASPEDIRELNDLKGDELLAGQPLLIMKNMEILK